MLYQILLLGNERPTLWYHLLFLIMLAFRMEVLFVKPLYGGPMIDQTLLLNRRQYEKEYSKNKQKKDEEDEKRRQEKEERKRYLHVSDYN